MLNSKITIGVILVTILITPVFAGQVLRQEVAGQEVPIGQIIEDVEKQTQVKNALGDMSNNQEGISIEDMFEMQMLMNRLIQLGEIPSPVIPALNSDIAPIG